MRIPGNKTILFLLSALLALTVAGCGGGGDETESTTTPTIEEPTALTKDELIEEGDDVCAEVNAAVGALSSSAASETEPGAQTEKVANLYTGMVEQLQDLGAPEGDDGSYVDFMEAAEELAKVEGEAKLAAEREDLEAMAEANGEAEVALEEFHSQAEIYGFEECSEEPGELSAPAAGGETEVPPSGEELEGLEEEGGVEPEYVEPEVEEEIVPEEEAAPETGGAGGGVGEAPAEPAPETGGESGGVGPG